MTEEYRGPHNKRHADFRALKDWTAKNAAEVAMVEDVLRIRREVATQVSTIRLGGSGRADSAPAVLPNPFAGNTSETATSAANGAGEVAAAVAVASAGEAPLTGRRLQQANRLSALLTFVQEVEPVAVPRDKRKFNHGSVKRRR